MPRPRKLPSRTARKPVLYVLTNNHFDLTWRRCWDRRFEFAGQSFVSYADIEDYYITDNLVLCRRHEGYKFEIESTAVLRQYLRRHPGKLAELRRLVRQGRLAVSGAGDNIIDANMVLGESLARNFVTGLLWLERTLGQTTRQIVRNDGFGNACQLPQIARLCEVKYVSGVGYSPLHGSYWRGLDGSCVFGGGLPVVASGGGVFKYPPCKRCLGEGCRICGGRGIELSLRSHLPATIDEATLRRNGAGVVQLAPEELLPNPQIIDWAGKLSRQYDVRFAIGPDLLPTLQPQIDAADDPPPGLLHDSLEANPNNSGTLVTRIKTKQRVRRCEYSLLAAETLAAAAHRAGQLAFPSADVESAWERLCFTMFHDAITGTHVDPAYRELMDVFDSLEADLATLTGRSMTALSRRSPGMLSVVNPFGHRAMGVAAAELPGRRKGVALSDESGSPVNVVDVQPTDRGTTLVTFVAAAKPLSAVVLKVRPAVAPKETALRGPVLENDLYRVEADEHGLKAIIDRRLGRPVSGGGTYRPGELILEGDEGSPWATLSPHRDRTPLAQHMRLEAAVRQGPRQQLRYALRADRPLGVVAGSYVVELVDGLPWVNFRLELQWRAFNHRLRVAMPVTTAGAGLYGVPYGAIERPMYHGDFEAWTGANGDWPAVNWAGVDGAVFSAAVLNKGLPSYRIEPDGRYQQTILLSLLRSPNEPTYLHEPFYYTMTDYDGMRDEGCHCLEFAFLSSPGRLADSDVVAAAEAFNAPPLTALGRVVLPALPRLVSDHVRIAALKPAESGEAMILRLAEFRGRSGSSVVHLPQGATSVRKVNLLERGGIELPVAAGTVELTVRPWEIITLRIE